MAEGHSKRDITDSTQSYHKMQPCRDGRLSNATLHWQSYSKDSSLTYSGKNANRPSMAQDNLIRYRQPETGSTCLARPRFVHSIEPIE